jgi:RHH-type proline utilization regulon transcriptional repressor/proline dehydrogenase/delta 1-pyrroline-5-carboxylate dehydrogenase
VQLPAGDPLAPIAQFMVHLSPAERERLAGRAQNYQSVYSLEFEGVHAQAEVLGQHNDFRYQGCRTLLYVAGAAEPVDALSAYLAATRASGEVVTAVVGDRSDTGTRVLAQLASVAQVRDLRGALEALETARVERLRAVGPIPDELLRGARARGVHVVSEAVHEDGYVELRHYLKEQSISTTFHRYGNLRLTGERQMADTPR